MTCAQGADHTEIRYVGIETWHGVLYDVLQQISSGNAGKQSFTDTTLIFIGRGGLIHRRLSHFTSGKNSIDSDTALSNARIGIPLTKNDFAFTLPPGAVQKEEFPSNPSKSEPPLPYGTQAPDFTAYDKDGKPVKLSDYKGKVVVLDFWSTWCGPCQTSLPHTNAVARKFKDKDVVVLAVNVWDTKAAFDAWLPKNKQYDAIVFAIDTQDQGKDVASTLYKVDGIPTQFVIGKDGKIVKSFVGYGGPTDDLEKAIKGVL